MDAAEFLHILLAAAAGYLLGSLSPAYFLRRRPAAITAFIDLGKGIAALLVAAGPLRLAGFWLLVPAWAALLGHVFPFYRGFRGGKGTAVCIGISLFFCAQSMLEGAFAVQQLAAVLAAAALVYIASRSGDLTALVGFFFLAIVTAVELGLTSRGVLMLTMSLYGFALAIRGCALQHLFRVDRQIEMKWWRVIARPFALLMIPIDLLFGRTVLLFVIAAIGVILIGMDIFRMLSRHQLEQLFKKKEIKRFSSMTSFIVAVFIIFLVFQDFIPYLGLAYITIGDMFSKIIGIKFGRHRLLRDRTLEGSLGFLAGSFMAGWVIGSLLPVPTYVLFAGPLFAAAVELFSMDLDDNFSVGIVSSGFLRALQYFLSR